MKKVLSAVGSDMIKELLKEYDVISDIPYQEGVIETIKRDFIDILVVYANLEGDMDKYMFIEKIREIDSKIEIFVIVDEEDDNYKNYLYKKGIFDIFVNEKTSKEELLNAINNGALKKPRKFDLSLKNNCNEKLVENKNRNQNRPNLTPRFQRQQIITFAGMSSSGKTTIAAQLGTLIAKNSRAKVLLIDFDTINAGLNQFFGTKRSPDKPDYILPPDKNSGINYMVDSIDKRTFDSNVFEKYVVKTKYFSNLDILTGNKSLFVCEKVLNTEYYSRILEKAKELYDFIIIDTSSNIFVDATQFSLLNSNVIFYVLEATNISFERTFRTIKEIFPVWGVNNNKIKLIINKYHKSSPSKLIINEMMKGIPIAGYISFSGKYDDCLNSGKPYVMDDEMEYTEILEDLNIITKKNPINKLKDKYLSHLLVDRRQGDVNRSVQVN